MCSAAFVTDHLVSDLYSIDAGSLRVPLILTAIYSLYVASTINSSTSFISHQV
jgi:hypothetical protein